MKLAVGQVYRKAASPLPLTEWVGLLVTIREISGQKVTMECSAKIHGQPLTLGTESLSLGRLRSMIRSEGWELVSCPSTDA